MEKIILPLSLDLEEVGRQWYFFLFKKFVRTVHYVMFNTLINSQLINSVLSELESVCDFEKDSVVIKLHGFFQTDDRIAIQEITRQLFLEKETANKVFGSFSGM